MSSPGLERNPETGGYISKQKRVVLRDDDLIRLVNSYVQEFRRPNGQPHIQQIREKLGWNIVQWSVFKKKCGHLINWDYIPKFSVIETRQVVDPNGVKQGLEERGISAEAIADKIETSFGQLRRDLYSIGLSPAEVDAAVAMQHFGQNRFANAMEMISSGVFSTAMKLQTEQRTIEKRLEDVRRVILEYGDFASDERDGWVAEEKNLIKSYATIGQLLSDIQDTWYQGSAQLALVRMRMRDDNGAPVRGVMKRSQRPGFSPRVIPQEVAQPEPPEIIPGMEANGNSSE
jgi:hypothetical protein